MGRGGTGLSSCASAWSGAAVTSKKDRHLITTGSLPSIAMSKMPPVRVTERLPETAAELGRSASRTAIVGKLVKNARQAMPAARQAAHQGRGAAEIEMQIQEPEAVRVSSQK